MVNKLKILERRIANQYMEDGLWDMYLGLMAFAFGLTILLDISYLAAIAVSIGFALQRLGKTLVTFPRIGYIRLRSAKKASVAAIFSAVLILGVMVFLLFMLGDENPVKTFVTNNKLLFLAVIWGGSIALAGLSLQVNRYYLYALLLFSAVIFSDLVGGLGLNLTITGLLIMLAGLIVMVRFIRKYPVVDQQD
jgi:hypothetical protein